MRSRVKVRGATRKCKALAEYIIAETNEFPHKVFHENEDGAREYYEHWDLLYMPHFLASTKAPAKIKRTCMQTLINQTKNLIDTKPDDEETRVYANIELPNLSRSNINVFFGDKHYLGFFDRNDEEQTWIPLPPHRSIAKEYALTIPEGMTVRGYKEIYNCDGVRYISELWFIGEIE